MKLIGNILWLLFGGFLSSISWALMGFLWCVTLIGIPIGVQCFKFATLSLCPFGKTVEYGGGAVSFITNLIWLIVSGLPLALEHIVIALILCVTIIGIPFAKQYFKLAKLSLMPFGAEVT